jgi:histone-lysine N-methyltransferase SETMAR
VIPHPPYSPDLTLCDFFLFPKIKLQLKRRNFDTTEEIHAELQEIINTLTFENFQECTKSWETHWDYCIHAQGNYFKGDGGN